MKISCKQEQYLSKHTQRKGRDKDKHSRPTNSLPSTLRRPHVLIIGLLVQMLTVRGDKKLWLLDLLLVSVLVLRSFCMRLRVGTNVRRRTVTSGSSATPRIREGRKEGRKEGRRAAAAAWQ